MNHSTLLHNPVYKAVINYYPNDEYRITLSRITYRPRKDAPLDIGSEFETAPNVTEITQNGNTKTVGTSVLKPGFGLIPRKTKFGLPAKRKLMRVGGALDKLNPDPSNVIFLTGTLPGSTPEAFQAIANWSAYIVHRLKAWINKRIASKYDFYVWEVQKRGALHLHYCVYCDDAAIASSILSDFKSEWIRILDSVSAKSLTDLYGRLQGRSWVNYKSITQAYAQRVRKSVSAYLAKYCSKNANREADQRYWPSRWWGCSRPLNALLGDMTKTVSWERSRLRSVWGIVEAGWTKLVSEATKHHEYTDKSGLHRCFVAYSKQSKFSEVICTMQETAMSRVLSRNLLVSGLSAGESITTRLKWTVQFLNLSPWKMSQLYSPSSATSLECLLRDGNLMLYQALEISQALEYLCFNLEKQGKSLGAVGFHLKSQSSISALLRSLCRKNPSSATMPLSSLVYDLTSKSYSLTVDKVHGSE